MVGSPPHTRGKVCRAKFKDCPGGITPAHAGKRLACKTLCSRTEDHPRTRGEKSKPTLKKRRKKGSPPHTRGKGISRLRLSAWRRITPAHAGKSEHVFGIIKCFRDHPRTRGEKFQLTDEVNYVSGSPPHTRGKECHALFPPVQSRITPAHAGKSRKCYSAFAPAEDHPRTRGEKSQVLQCLCSRRGSPPHTRGKGAAWATFATLKRITPAHAGKSLAVFFGCCRWGDHPRTRGEKHTYKIISFRRVGSPPHTRGKVPGIVIHRHRGRITPAHAGKRCRSEPRRQALMDHPRTRGEKRHCRRKTRTANGSPPHTRGKVKVKKPSGVLPGITPAHAGKSRKISNLDCQNRDHPRTRGEKFPLGLNVYR